MARGARVPTRRSVSFLLSIWVPGWQVLPKDYVDISGVSWPALRVTRSPPEATRRGWKRLRAFVTSHARLVTRWGPLDGPRADIWAMPAALRALQSGMERAENPGSAEVKWGVLPSGQGRRVPRLSG